MKIDLALQADPFIVTIVHVHEYKKRAPNKRKKTTSELLSHIHKPVERKR